MKHSSSNRTRVAALALASLAAFPSAAAAQFDVQVDQIRVTQSMQAGGLLTGERSTFVRVTTILTNPPALPVALDGLMRVYVNGVEVPESPVFSINGPHPAVLSPDLANEDDTLNFSYLPPVSNNVVFEIEINPSGPNFVAEANTANNIKAKPALVFQEHGIPDFAYVPVDYRPMGGGTANLPPELLTRPSKGDNFVQGIYPVSDVEYHRTDAPSKLWTASISATAIGLLNSLEVDLALMNPAPDYLYGWIPGGLGYNGSTLLTTPVGVGNTETDRFQRTYAFLISRSHGFSTNSNQIGKVGVDVEHHLNLPQSNNIPRIKPDTLFDIMFSGLRTHEAWVEAGTYMTLFNLPLFAPGPAPVASKAPALFVNGSWNAETGAVELAHVFDLSAGALSLPATPGSTEFLVRTYAGGDLLQELAVGGGVAADGVAPTLEQSFSAVLQRGPTPIDRLEIIPAGVEAKAVTLARSPNAPTVRFLAPGANGQVSNARISVVWEGRDADGDTLAYYLRYSSDGVRFSPLATGIRETSVEVDLSQLPALVDGAGFFQLIASDGLNTTVANSAPLTGSAQIFAAGGGNDPWVNVCSPDDGTSHVRGATVILHSSGWDLEDRALRGSSIVWSSDLDGTVATGRVTSYAGFSVGTHQLTVTATDSAGQTDSETAQIVVTGRGLPGWTGGVVYCTAGTSASGCKASISVSGTPSASAASGFTVDAIDVEGSKDGLFFYGSNGSQANNWGNGSSYQCVVPPVKRTGLQAGVGTPGQCDGAFSTDLTSLWSSVPAKNPGAGALMRAQCWYRDPFNTSNRTTSLSDAVEVLVLP